MNKHEFSTFLGLMMCSDPWPMKDEDHAILEDYANRVSREYGYESWYVAYHELPKESDDAPTD